jgi:quinol-cytochrome oxidoreductase complex cytochrome b subunit
MAAPTIGSAGAPAAPRKSGPSLGQRIAVGWRKNAQNLDLFDENATDRVKQDPWYMLGGMSMLFWLVTIATGTLLIFFYVPTTYQAYRSVLAIKEEIPVMWFVRALHKYGADALIISLTMRVYRMYFRGEFKNYNQLSYTLTIIGLILAMFSGLTGYLLIWNQRALWATKVFATFPTFIDDLHQIPTIENTPILANTVGWLLQNTLGVLSIGKTTATYMLAGASIGPATLTRFYSAHFMLSILTLILVEAYFARKGAAGRVRRINLPWYAVVAFLAILTLVSVFVPVDLGSPANPNVTPNPILSDWYFLGLYQLMKLWKPTTATLMTILIPAIAIACAFWDSSADRSPWKRPVWTVVGLWGLIMWIAFSVMICLEIADIQRDPPIIYTVSAIMLGAGILWNIVYRRREARLKRAEAAAKAAAQAAREG